MSDVADPGETSDEPAASSQKPPAPKRGAFPTPRSVIDQAPAYAPEQPVTERDPDRSTPPDADPDR